jgi:hypothetical protein
MNRYNKIQSSYAVAGLLILISASSLKAQTSQSCDMTNIPAPVTHDLITEFPRWKVKQISDLDAENQQLWLKAHGTDCPGIAIGHFESTERLGYAILIVPKSEPTGGYKLLIFRKRQTSDSYSWKQLDHVDGAAYSGLVISKAEPGKYADFGATRSVQTKLDGIYVEWIEKGASLYYWSVGQYHKLSLSE